ncbi:hypothetical protein QWZ08_22695 [Ferruginibacter paludis]|uniref:hypothetical protein n=1 Tax=Ferruginibacter paludis TaxID=1310417 RepID=UPI0025B33ED1|nr:hypothetical protein [Ferruginibacter paludis]MDN3658470.1 hypothetical protein [Ferruginibacter paludis]
MLQERIITADSVAINFFKGDGTMDTVVVVKIIRDKKTITSLSNAISASTTKPDLKCGYDGSLHFFKNNMVLQDIDFRMNDATCKYFTFKQAGELKATVLSDEASRLLQDIRSNDVLR